MKKRLNILTIALIFSIGTDAEGQIKNPAQKSSSGYRREEEKAFRSPLTAKIDDYQNRSVPFGFSGAILVRKTARSSCKKVTV